MGGEAARGSRRIVSPRSVEEREGRRDGGAVWPAMARGGGLGRPEVEDGPDGWVPSVSV
jgi:hypothetical protein